MFIYQSPKWNFYRVSYPVLFLACNDNKFEEFSMTRCMRQWRRRCWSPKNKQSLPVALVPHTMVAPGTHDTHSHNTNWGWCRHDRPEQHVHHQRHTHTTSSIPLRTNTHQRVFAYLSLRCFYFIFSASFRSCATFEVHLSSRKLLYLIFMCSGARAAGQGVSCRCRCRTPSSFE